MDLEHIRCLTTEKVALNVQLCVVKVAKCEQSVNQSPVLESELKSNLISVVFCLTCELFKYIY
jgi:hypothetical protein